jgi:hypothetical protein
MTHFADKVASVAGAVWSPDELRRIDDAEELEISPPGRHGLPRRWVPIWVVRVGEDLYVRSWRGRGGAWFRAARATHTARVRAGGVEKEVALVDADDDVDDRVDAAYRSKYGRYPSYVEPMVRPEARVTTLKLLPRGDWA